LDKENSPTQTARHQKIPCSLLKKIPLAILADWTSFAQIIYRCNPGTAEGTRNCATSIFAASTLLGKSLLQRSGQASAQPLFPTDGYTFPGAAGVTATLQRCFRQPGCLGEMFQAGLAAVPADSLSARPALKVALG